MSSLQTQKFLCAKPDTRLEQGDRGGGRCYDHNFRQFWAKKMAFFSKTNVMVKFLQNIAAI
jgi:hypothetical protein